MQSLVRYRSTGCPRGRNAYDPLPVFLSASGNEDIHNGTSAEQGLHGLTECCPCGADVIHQNKAHSVHLRRGRKSSAQVLTAGRGVQSALMSGVDLAHQQVWSQRDIKCGSHGAAQFLALVKPPLAQACRVQRHGNKGMGRGKGQRKGSKQGSKTVQRGGIAMEFGPEKKFAQGSPVGTKHPEGFPWRVVVQAFAAQMASGGGVQVTTKRTMTG